MFNRNKNTPPPVPVQTPKQFAEEFWDVRNLENHTPRPPIQQDPKIKLDTHPDYRYWNFGKEKVTAYLEDGATVLHGDLADPEHYDYRIEGASYTTLSEIPTYAKLSRQDRHSLDEKALERTKHRDAEEFSSVYFEERLRLVLNEPDLHIVHMLTQLVRGYADPVYGYVLDEKQ